MVLEFELFITVINIQLINLIILDLLVSNCELFIARQMKSFDEEYEL